MIFTNVGHAIPFPRYTHIEDGMLRNIDMYPYISTHMNIIPCTDMSNKMKFVETSS